MTKTIGTCSRCGGPVTVPTAWYATVPPVPTCAHCGATKAQPYGPVIEMDEPAPRHSIIGVGDQVNPLKIIVAPKFEWRDIRTSITHWSRTTL